jgi:uncharacterized protein YndB with AHSA1/START domain
MTGKASPVTQTHREVGRRPIAAGEARTAVMRRRYDAPIQDVWDACTNPDRLSRWFLKVTGELRVGGTFSLAGNASGEILRCDPPRLLAVTWVYGDQPVDQVELRLSPGQDGATILELEHASVSEVAPDGSTGAVVGVGVGWELALDYLGKSLGGQLPSTPGQELTQQDFEPTPQDMELVQVRGQAWAALVQAAARPRRTQQDTPRPLGRSWPGGRDGRRAGRRPGGGGPRCAGWTGRRRPSGGS